VRNTGCKKDQPNAKQRADVAPLIADRSRLFGKCLSKYAAAI